MADGRGRAKAIAALAAVSLLGALGSLRGDLWPGPFRAAEAVPGLERQALAWAEMAVCAGGLALTRRRGLSRAAAREAAVAGLGMYAVPALLAALAGEWVGDLTRVAVFGMVPVLAVVLEPHLGGRETGRGALGAALVAVTGMLLVFPVELTGMTAGTTAGVLGLGAIVLAAVCAAAANCRAVWAAELGGGVAARAAVAAGSAAAALAAMSLTTEHWTAARGLGAQAAWVAAVELPGLLLVFWLTSRMTAARMTLRYVLAPLAASVAGIVLFLPAVSWQAAAGLVLTAGGAAWMLAIREVREREQRGLGL
ncbi:MAG: hypothetical protein P4L40_20530 [Terracidiphilus sp.]|nr:hypothetical protein [Terracidiphilus sp.]